MHLELNANLESDGRLGRDEFVQRGRLREDVATRTNAVER